MIRVEGIHKRFGALEVLKGIDLDLRPGGVTAIRTERCGQDDAGGSTILLTSHIMSELERLADDVVFLLEGRVRYRGSLAEIRTETGEPDLEGAIAQLMGAGAGA